jgi:hypothetical protein
MNIIIKTIPHSNQRYETIGDWIFNDNGDLEIYISDTGNIKYEFLIAIHEAIEAFLCMDRNIQEKDVYNFDLLYESQREPNDYSEPGDHFLAPYRKEHFFATNIERLIAAELNINWQEYDNDINKII